MTESRKNKVAIEKLVTIKNKLKERRQYLEQKKKSYLLTGLETAEFKEIKIYIESIKRDLNTLEANRSKFSLTKRALREYNDIWRKYKDSECN